MCFGFQLTLEFLHLSHTETLQGLKLVLLHVIHPSHGSSQADFEEVINVLWGKAVLDRESHLLVSAETLQACHPPVSESSAQPPTTSRKVWEGLITV